jgi:FkbM family methyltransferase
MKQSIDVHTIINSEYPLILDIGCYNGDDSVNLLTTIPNSKVYSFEADPDVWPIFEKHVSSRIEYPNDNLILVKTGISNESGTIIWNRSNQLKSGTLNTPTGHLIKHRHVTFEQVMIECTTLDIWYANNIPNQTIDFIWCDVNGAERKLIEGGINTLNNHTKYIRLECCEHPLWEDQIFEKDILTYLTNFKLIKRYGNDILLKNKIIK